MLYKSHRICYDVIVPDNDNGFILVIDPQV